MSQDRVWDDTARQELRETLRVAILGQLRLAQLGPDEILEHCHDFYIEDDCPENESEKFMQFAADELDRAVAVLETEKAAWPGVTDCDRLDRVEAALRERGILLWQASPCCDSCTVGELSDRISMIDDRSPGFEERARGYAFFIDQNLPEELAESRRISVYLGYGWIAPRKTEVPEDVYQAHALGIAREVCECLRSEGFEPDWNGEFARKIGISLNWQRRTTLE